MEKVDQINALFSKGDYSKAVSLIKGFLHTTRNDNPSKHAEMLILYSESLLINGDLKEFVQRIRMKMGVLDPNQYLFLNKYGTKPIDRSYVNVKLKELFKRYDINVEGNISSHMFRKTLGNRVLKLNNYSNESVILLMELFSHSSPAITRRYLGLREREILDVYDSLRLLERCKIPPNLYLK